MEETIYSKMGFHECTPETVEVGMLCTRCYWSDRHVYEITKILKADDKNCKFECLVRQMQAIRTDNNGMSESQDYIYKQDLRNPEELVKIVGTKYKRLREVHKNYEGKNVQSEEGWVINYAHEYFDFSF